MSDRQKKININDKTENVPKDIFNAIGKEVKEAAVESEKKKNEKEGLHAQILSKIKSGSNDKLIIGQQLFGKEAYKQMRRREGEKERREKFLAHLSPVQQEELNRRQSNQGRIRQETVATSAQRSSEDSQREQQQAAAAKAQAEARAEMTRAAQMRAKLQAKIQAAKAKLSLQRQKADLDAYTWALVFVAFGIAIIADLSDLLLDGSMIGSVISPGISVIVDLVLGLLWWSMGVGNSNEKIFKYGERLGLTAIVEAIPFVNMLPGYTVMCAINFLDLIGFFDKIGNIAGGSGSGNAAGN